MSTRDIVETFRELYGADISPALVSKVTEAVLDKVIEWQSRPFGCPLSDPLSGLHCR
jgi:putative transposase